MSDNFGITTSIGMFLAAVTILIGAAFYTAVATHEFVPTVTSCTTTYVGPVQ